MFRIERSVFAVVAIAGFALIGALAGVPGMALGAGADDPTTFSRNPVTTNGKPTLEKRSFHVEWTVEPGRPGMSRISGYVYNDYIKDAENVALQVAAVDSGGRPVSSMVQRFSATVPARGRSYFDVQVPASQTYEVRVIGFDFQEGPGNK